MTAETIIDTLRLQPHPEGGYYRETYRSESSFTLKNGHVRSAGTAIYYLLKETEKSHFHRIQSDEIWLFHQGEALEILLLTAEGKLEIKVLGNRIGAGEEPQVLIPAQHWFAARVKGEKGYSLVSCMVAPGFDFDDFELASKTELLKSFPHLEAEIAPFCR